MAAGVRLSTFIAYIDFKLSMIVNFLSTQAPDQKTAREILGDLREIFDRAQEPRRRALDSPSTCGILLELGEPPFHARCRLLIQTLPVLRPLLAGSQINRLDELEAALLKVVQGRGRGKS